MQLARFTGAMVHPSYGLPLLLLLLAVLLHLPRPSIADLSFSDIGGTYKKEIGGAGFLWRDGGREQPGQLASGQGLQL